MVYVTSQGQCCYCPPAAVRGELHGSIGNGIELRSMQNAAFDLRIVSHRTHEMESGLKVDLVNEIARRVRTIGKQPQASACQRQNQKM